jgi:glycyl-tRNA synthetase beta chain
MSARDFLVEIGTEELPPKALRELELAFADGIRSGLCDASLTHGDIESFATPRRLAVRVNRVAAEQPDQEIRRRGPPVSAAFDASGAPTRAALAFAQTCGVDVDTLKRIDEGKGPALFFLGSRQGAAAVALLPQIVSEALDRLPIPKRMRWGSGTAEFVRPVHWVVMLWGSQPIPATIMGVSAGNATQGHRFHAPKPIRVTSPHAYAKILRDRGHVIAQFAERRSQIRQQVEETASGIGGRALIESALLDEVTALVEWPVAIGAQFDPRFLELPREVLISTLQDHQRYFPIEDAQGRLTPWFVAVSNIQSLDPSKVRAGNERVVRPRLADAAFFWAQDRKQPLAALLPGLDSVTFQAKLGSIGDKVRRVRTLAGEIAAAIGSDRAAAERAADLSKCDLLTAMVGEFPELQGIMGEHYARADGESEDIAVAVREHYAPRAAGDEVPRSPIGMAVGIADKIDTLTGIFATGQKPSGTKDPFGLRRAALGLVRTIIERALDLDLRSLIERSAERQPVVAAAVSGDVYDYVMERLRSYYLDGAATITTEMFDAVLATKPASPLDFDSRLRALVAFLSLPEAASLTSANKRIANILRKADTLHEAPVVPEALKEPAEIKLYDALRAQKDIVRNATAQREYSAALGHLAQLRAVVDSFFDQVMVMADDPAVRGNRLALLGELSRLFGGIADLSRLPG